MTALAGFQMKIALRKSHRPPCKASPYKEWAGVQEMQGPEGSSVSWCFHLLPFLLLAWTCCPAPLPSRNGEPGLPSLCQHHRGGLWWRQRLVFSGTISARNISDSSSSPISSLPPPSTKINGISLVASETGMEMAYVVPTMFTINQKVVPYKVTMPMPLLL